MEVSGSANGQETGICVKPVTYLRGDGEDKEVGGERMKGWQEDGGNNTFAASSKSNEVDPPHIGGSLMNGWTNRAQVRDEAARCCLEWNKIKKKEKKEEGGSEGFFLFSQVSHSSTPPPTPCSPPPGHCHWPTVVPAG